jgi:hypothetical protein
MKKTAFFQSLSFVSIGLAIFNTVKSNNYRRILDELKKEKAKAELLKQKYDELVQHKIDELEVSNEVTQKQVIIDKGFDNLRVSLVKINNINGEITNEGLSKEEFDNKTQELYNATAELKKQISTTNNNFESIINTIQNWVSGKGGSSGTTSQLLDSFKELQNFFETLNFIDSYAIVHISGVLFIFITLNAITLTLFGNKLIIYFNIENKYPKIAKFI